MFFVMIVRRSASSCAADIPNVYLTAPRVHTLNAIYNAHCCLRVISQSFERLEKKGGLCEPTVAIDETSALAAALASES